MAKATAPLFAIEASGQIGKTVVYDRRGFVRIYTIPTNPKTANQTKVRCMFKAMANAVRNTHKEARDAIKAHVEPSYRWSAEAIGTALKNNGWEVQKAAYNSLDSTTKGNWQSSATTLGITVDATAPCFQGISSNAAGFVLYAYTRALIALGLTEDDYNSDDPTNWEAFLQNN